MSPISQITGEKPRVELAAGQAAKLVLLVLSNGNSKGCLRLSEKNVLVGSSPDCTVCLRSSWVKDFQCQIIQGKQHTLIRNLSPETRLNDQLFTEAWLKPGDCISCGPIDINVLKVSSLCSEQSWLKLNENCEAAVGQQSISHEVLEKLQQQAAELRQSLEQERARSEQRVKELESNLLASRDHLRCARKQLIALRGRSDQLDHEAESSAETGKVEISQPAETAQPVDDRCEAATVPRSHQSDEKQGKSTLAQIVLALAEKKRGFFTNFMAAEACCDVENLEIEECDESQQEVELVEQSLQRPEERLAHTSRIEATEFAESLSTSKQTDVRECDVDLTTVDGREPQDHSEFSCDAEVCDIQSEANFDAASDCFTDFDDYPAPDEHSTSEPQGDHDGEISLEAETAAESLESWFDPQRNSAGWDPDLPVDPEESRCELPEDLMSIIRECEQVASTVEAESHLENHAAHEFETLQNDEPFAFDRQPNVIALGITLPNQLRADEAVHDDQTILASSAQEFVASETEIFETVVQDQSVSEESTCEIITVEVPNAAESECSAKNRSLVGRMLSLFGKRANSFAAVDRMVEGMSHNESAAHNCDEIANEISFEAGQFGSESFPGEDENQSAEEFDLTSDWKNYLAVCHPQNADVIAQMEHICTSESEIVSAHADTEARDACLKFESGSAGELSGELSSEEVMHGEPSDDVEQIPESILNDDQVNNPIATDVPTDCAVEQSEVELSQETVNLICAHHDELDVSYDKVLDSLKSSSNDFDESPVEVAEPSEIADDHRVCSHAEVKQGMGQQLASIADAEFQAETECQTVDASDLDSAEKIGSINSEPVAVDSFELSVEGQEGESIEEYMNKLLHRVGVCRQSSQQVSGQTDLQCTGTEAQPARPLSQPEELLAKTFGQDLESRKKELGPVEISPKSLPVLETNHLDEMRLMARASANSAIEASLRRKTSTQATVQLGIGCLLLVGGIVQTTLAQGLTSASALATIPCYVASVYFFKKYFDWRKSFASLDAKFEKQDKQGQPGVKMD